MLSCSLVAVPNNETATAAAEADARKEAVLLNDRFSPADVVFGSGLTGSEGTLKSR